MRQLHRHGIHTEVVISEYPGHLFNALPARLREPWEVIVALGGDGTLFQVVNCCLHHPGFNTPIALIPAGTGNSFSKEFTGDQSQPAWRRIVDSQPRAVDVIHCQLDNPGPLPTSDFYLLTVLGLGFVSEVTVNATRYKRLGMLAYALAVFLSLASLTNARVTMTLDGNVIERQPALVEVCNSRITGGNMLINPDSRIDDGLLEVVLLNRVTRWELVRAFPSVFTGQHVHHPAVEVFRGRRLRIESDPPQILTPDGEVAGQTPVDIEIQSGRLNFIL